MSVDEWDVSGAGGSGTSKRSTALRQHHSKENAVSPAVVPQHDEIIKFICDSWTKVMAEYNQQRNNPHVPTTVHYHEEGGSNPALKDFVPFNLEEWWGKRLVKSLNQNT